MAMVDKSQFSEQVAMGWWPDNLKYAVEDESTLFYQDLREIIFIKYVKYITSIPDLHHLRQGPVSNCNTLCKRPFREAAAHLQKSWFVGLS